jgi:hypothetical protein
LPVAIGLLYLVFRVNAPYLRPELAAILPPADPSALGKALPVLTGDPRQRVTQDSIRLAEATALSAPLAFEPFFVQAKVQEQAGKIPNAIRLMEEARRRRPSFDLTRIHLVYYYQQARMFPQLLAEIDYVLRRSSEAGQVILPELAKLMRDPQGRSALASILAGEPAWKQRFFEIAAEQPGTPADALALLNLIEARRPPGGVALERGLYLRRLVQAGDHSRARAIWLETLPPGERGQHALLFNGTFRAVSAPEPFGWTVRQQAQGRAEIVTRGTDRPYLDIVYYGGSNVVLAEQQLALAPGRYRLSVLARSDQQPTSGQIFWRLTCLPQGAEIGRMAIGRVQTQYGRSTSEFVVPANCAGQQLALVAEPGDIAAEIRMQLSGLELVRAD